MAITGLYVAIIWVYKATYEVYVANTKNELNIFE